MSSKVYGASDDLIEFVGDIYGESNPAYGGGDACPALLAFSDGTLLAIVYGKPGLEGVWGITLISRGSLFVGIDQCADENADIHSDVAHFSDGLKWAYCAKDWEKVK